MEAALVGVGTGVMKPLLSKLSNLLEKEYAKVKGVRREVESTRSEMRSMKAALEALAEAEQLDPEMIEWRDEVRELSFDMEDCVDDFMSRADTKQDGRKGLKGFFDKLKKLKPRHEIAGEIKELKDRAIEASQRHKRYKLGRSTPDSTTRDIDPRLHALYVEVDKLVGIEGPKKHIIDWFNEEGSSTKLRVVSIVGPGGLGKTTLGNAVFQTIKEEFSCKAFVSVSRKPNMKIVLKDIARRVGMAHDPSNDDERWLIDSLREHLQDKKYLVVIDDLWSTEAWKTIKDALLNNEHGSRIITTTRNSAVASFCSSEGDSVYRMEPLSSVDSRRLFLGRAFRSEDLCPPHLKEVSERILEKCAGLPLAIITLSSLLSDQTAKEVWNKALAAVGSSLANKDGAGDMTKILSLSYFDLPHYMRACLLYLSAYPEDDIIEKKMLIHKWMAEGFVREVEGQSTYEVGEGYFNDFINRSLIQPDEVEGDQEHYGEVMSCRVHDIILDFITCKAKEENFMTSFGDAEHGGKHKVRRLSVVSRDNGMATMLGDLSHVRSLAVFGYASQNFALDFPVLRVLDIELHIQSLANIEKLLLLKYLRLRASYYPHKRRYDRTSYSIAEIPEGIGKLKYLETLDMRDVRIRKLPSTMTQLQRLARLYANFEPACLSDGIIGQLQSLEELEDVQVSKTELEKFLQELGQLTKLRTLSVYVKRSALIEKVDNVRFLGALISSYNLHHLTISYDTKYSRQCLLSLESWCLVNPVALRKICINDYNIDKVPNWMISLGNLSVLHLVDIYCTGPEDIAILGGIPALVSLKLKTWYGRNGKIFVRTGFRSLKYFSLDISCCGTAVEFEEGSMPKLEHLKLKFQAHKEECVNYAFDFGIQHLSTLTKLDLCSRDDSGIINKLIETALGKFRQRPTLSWERRGSQVCSPFETSIELEWEKEKEREEENGEGGGPCSFLGLLLEEIKQDALPRMRVMGMMRSLDKLAKSLCAADHPAAAESAAIACALSEIQREISSTDGPTKAAASHHLFAIARHLLASPAAAAAAPDDLFVHLAEDLVPHLARGSPHAIAEAARVLAASPSTAFSLLFKPLTLCLTSPDPRASTAAAVAFCKLSAPPADIAPYLSLVPHLYNLLTTPRSIWALINVLTVLARLVPLESSIVVDSVCQLLARSSDMFLTFQCIRAVMAARPAQGASLAIRKVKEFLSGARDANLGLLALGMLHPVYANECRDVITLLMNDVNSTQDIRREALQLLMEMVDGDNIMGIAGMLVSHAAKSDPKFADEIFGAVLAACARNVYELVMDLDWYVWLLADMARSVRCARGQGDEIARQLVDVGLRVRDARPQLVHAAKTLLIDPALLGNHLLCPLLSAAAWVSGEYAEFSKDDPVELMEALLQPRTSLLPMSVRAIYIQAAHKVIISCCSIYLERSSDSNKEWDVVFKRLAIDQTVNGGSEAAIGSEEEQQIVGKYFFSEKSILHMIKLIEAKVGPLVVECNEVEVLERARDLIGFVHLIKVEVSDDEKFTQAKELVKNMQTVFSQELSSVSVNAQNHPDFRSGHRQGKGTTQPDVVPQAPCNSETNIRQPYISAGTLSYFGDAQRFESVFKVKRRTFNYICCLVKPVEDISLLDGRVLLIEDQVAIALRMFICAAPVETVLSDVGVSRSTFGLIFWRFVEAMLQQASHHLCWPDSMKMESTKSKFELFHGMPNCCGVVDTTYITTPPSAEPNCGHEKKHSIAVQTVVDPDSRITKISMEWSDSILQSSGLFKKRAKGHALNGSKRKLSDESEVGEYIIGDAGYPLLPWLLTPYQEKDLSGPKLEFNRRHSAARTIAQRVLARLKDTWKWMYLGGSWGLFPQELLHLSAKITHVSCLLHNIVIDMEGAALEEERIPSNHDMNYRQQACQLADKNAVRVRDILSQHFAHMSLKFGGTLFFLEDEKRFESFFKVKRRTFNYICCLVKSMEDVRSYTFLDGRVMCSEDQVAVALKMLISGGPVETVASDFSIKESTVSLVTSRFVEAMMTRGSYHVRRSESIEMEKIKSKFDLIHMLPNCCGVIDTTYIWSAQPNRGHAKNYSLVVQVVVDPDTRFIHHYGEWSGTKNQSSILRGSQISVEREKSEWLNGGKVKLSDGSEVGEYLIGDAGFPLLPWLLTPYREKDLSDPKVEFNRRLSAVRAITLRGLARLKDTWKCLHGELGHPENPREFYHIIMVCCMLHNIVIDMEGKSVEEEYVPNSCDVNYRQEVCQLVANKKSVRMRDELSQHLASRPSRSVGDED